MIHITPLGGGREIGANSYVLRWNGATILLDAGMHPTETGEAALMNVSGLPDEIDAVILSHGHLDHIGSLPYLVREHSVNNIILPQTSVKIITRMLWNTSSVIKRQYPEFWDQQEFHGYHKQALTALCDRLQVSGKGYQVQFKVSETISGYFFDAGHVLGSAGVILTDGQNTIGYTGDIGLNDHGVHRGCKLPSPGKLDCLLIESTTASDGHRDKDYDAGEKLYAYINQAMENHARILIPAFALGRTQDILALIAHGQEAGQIGNIPVYVTGLGNAITEIYDSSSQESLRKLFSWAGTLGEICQTLDRNQLLSRYRYHRKRHESAIFIATNGMMKSGTPSAELAKVLVRDSEDMILFTGYQAPGSLGYDVLKCITGDKIDFHGDGEKTRVKTDHRYQIHLSAHASRDDLVAIARSLNPDTALVIHGETNSTEWLTKQLKESGIDTLNPVNHETIVLYDPTKDRIEPLHRYRAIIVTVGISSLRWYREWKDKNVQPTPEDLFMMYRSLSAQPEKPCAEIQTLSQMKPGEKDMLYFIAGDDELSSVCAAGLHMYYEDQGLNSVVKTVSCLSARNSNFRDIGLPAFVNQLAAIIDHHDRHACLVATGGYKAVTAMTSLVGAFMKIPVYYIHEDMDTVITFNRMPLGPDFRLLKGQSIKMAEALYAPSLEKAWNIVRNNLRPGLEVLFQEKADGSGLEYSPMGKITTMLFQRYLNRKTFHLDHLSGTKYVNYLWGTGSLAIQAVPDQEIRQILRRIGRKGDLIDKITLLDYNKERKSRTSYLEFIKQSDTCLEYRIHSGFGTQDICLHHQPGLGDEILDELGKKIYA